MKLFDVYPRYEVEPVKASGSTVWDKNGKTYLDFYGGHAVISIGHAHPHFVSTIHQQLEKLPFYSNAVPNAMQDELAEKLGEISNCKDYELFLCNSGAEANENALKVASFYNSRKKVIAFKKGFHGRTSAAVNTTDNLSIQAPLNQGFEVERHSWDKPELVLESLAKGDVCAVIIEAVQGIGGIHIAPDEFLNQLSKACFASDTVLILDEVQAGYGRTGEFFAFQHSKIKPDLISIAKGMGNGFPIGGVLISNRFESRYGLLGSTFGGAHLACAAGIAVLDVIHNENLIALSATNGQLLINALNEIEGIKTVRGRGLMIGIELPFDSKAIRNDLLYNEQVFTGSSSDKNVLRLLPPLTVSIEEIDQFLNSFKKVFTKHLEAQAI
ncbi:MAG: aminotransferase class III-fold pyridoxal phosphate-dependent enzyme [Bacteroidota bacterium]